jgi:hypothetical protein
VIGPVAIGNVVGEAVAAGMVISLALPASNFFKGLLEYYGIEYLNLNPNGIFHTSVFVHFCEAFLGIKPH